MSNSVADVYAPCPGEDAPRHGRERQAYDAIHAKISPRKEVLRLLPTRDRRMVGAWGFADIYGLRIDRPRRVDARR